MIYGSVCSGIEAASVAWHPLGWRAAFLSEIEPFPRAVLAHHWPDVPLHGDFTTIEAGQYEPIELLVGGTPCQSFSVAGLRGGLADGRGNLALGFLRLAQRLRPRWVVWENVPGVLSSNGGRDFGAVLGGLAELGYGWAYRILDAQYFGLAQRRRRVFVVGCLGDWRRAVAVLFERASLSGYPAPRREAGERPAPTIASRPTGGGGLGTDFDCDGGLHVIKGAAIGRAPENGPQYGEILSDGSTYTLNCTEVHGVAHALRADGFDASEDSTGRGTPLVPVVTGPITTTGNAPGAYGEKLDSGLLLPVAPVFGGMAVRRLTPRECERLQGFPDDYTLVPHRGRPATDGPRYKALGNSMAVPCMRWIGERIQLVESLTAAERVA